MKLTKISAGSYQCGDVRVLSLKDFWIVWNVTTQTRTARDCPNTKWCSSFAEAKQTAMAVK
jgi:hypothetical protein